MDAVVPPLELKHSAHSLPALLKENSTVGELVTFPNRTTRSKQGRTVSGQRSKDDSRIIRQNLGGPAEGRKLRRTKSERSLNQLAEQMSIKKRPASLSSLEQSELSDDREISPKTLRKRSERRRHSMMEALKDDLEKLPRLQALMKPSYTNRSDGPDVSDVSDADDNAWEDSARRQGRRRRSSSVFRSGSRKSVGSGDFAPVLTEAELKKLKLIQNMNLSGNNAKSRGFDRQFSHDSQNGEVAILEASFARGGRRTSIATHVLMKARSRQAAVSDSGSLVGPGRDAFVSGAESNQKEEVTEESQKTFRRRWRRRKMRPVQVWRKRAKFVILLLRVWKIHSNSINEILVENNESLDIITRGNNVELLFDVTEYKASKEAKISSEVKRILTKPPLQRTSEEQYYVQIFLRNYKSISEYPVKIQTMIAQRSWIESYDIKRVIVREGHVPMCFYFILTGSAIVSTLEAGAPKTVMFLSRGDSFGDVSILNNSRRETTVISREKIELLCMTDTDFVDIFMSGGMRDPNDAFLKSISFLDGWPRELLVNNPKRCIFSYFKRGTVLVNDTCNNDWIFVIKSGSASLLKKLHAVNLKAEPVKKKKFWDLREEGTICNKQVLATNPVQAESLLSHEEQVQLLFEEENRNVEDQNLHVRFYALPEINVPTNESYNELRQMKEEFVNANIVNRALGALEKLADAGVDVKSETGHSGSLQSALRDESVKKMKQGRRNSMAFLKGLADLLFENQPNFSIISNGAECIMIEKKFFLEHASQALVVKLKEATFPYPSNDVLQSNLDGQMRWDAHKKRTLNKVLSHIKERKSNGAYKQT
ncbi:uncharacterized protein LOC127868549 [Dreissena polymorpha]|uniref:uncharacterized protein LOC127868549 n=1 Tax=Dreissena polymorpha TaxID=45954 RepID=UPI0022644AAD|nr:uncharacterized protein LOC127868549 [Dreissena polymorpha]